MGRAIWTYVSMLSSKTEEHAAYNNNINLFDVVMPLHGGILEADGSWTQEPWKFGHAFAVALPTVSREQGQKYAPCIAECTDIPDWNTFLETPGLWQAALDGFLTMYAGRYDHPWDGVMLNLEGTYSANKDKLTDFSALLADTAHSAGLEVYQTSAGRTEATDNWYDGVYAYDHVELNKSVDQLSYGISGYWLPLPRSFAPYWYLIESLSYVMDTCQIPAGDLVATMLCFSKLISNGGAGDSYSYADALEYIGDATIEWIEANENGTLRHNRAVLEDESTMWFTDGAWLQARLPLLDGRGIDSLTLFGPGMASPDLWQVIEEWKQRTLGFGSLPRVQGWDCSHLTTGRHLPGERRRSNLWHNL